MRSTLSFANEAGKVLSIVGAVVAAMAFERGEYMRRTWLTYGGCFLLLLVNDALAAAGATGQGALFARGAIVAAANACSVVGTWRLARAQTVAGLEDGGVGYFLKRALFIVLAVVVTGLPLLTDTRALLGGKTSAVVLLASDLGDTLTLAMVAPVMQTALALRGGLLRWPWGFLSASCVGWIAYDVLSGVLEPGKMKAGAILVFCECLRMIANGYNFSAGIAQRLVLDHGKRLSLAPGE
jgi:hypothetical protein